MPGKKKGKKKKTDEAKKEVKENTEPVPTGSWILLKFVLLEEDWPFADHELYVEARHPIQYITKKIEDYHGKIKKIRFYQDKAKQNIITNDFTATMEHIFKDSGAPTKNQANTHTIYYSFDLDIDCPLLNYDNFVIIEKQPV